jgi:hypothetical protein
MVLGKTHATQGLRADSSAALCRTPNRHRGSQAEPAGGASVAAGAAPMGRGRR